MPALIGLQMNEMKVADVDDWDLSHSHVERQNQTFRKALNLFDEYR